jgi:DNA-binding protein YbaB
MATPLADKIAALKARRARVDEQLRAEVAKAEEKERKRLARRKTVVGGAILAAIEGDESLTEIVAIALAMHVTAPADRETVADLLERANKAGNKPAATAKGSKAA